MDGAPRRVDISRSLAEQTPHTRASLDSTSRSRIHNRGERSSQSPKREHGGRHPNRDRTLDTPCGWASMMPVSVECWRAVIHRTFAPSLALRALICRVGIEGRLVHTPDTFHSRCRLDHTRTQCTSHAFAGATAAKARVQKQWLDKVQIILSQTTHRAAGQHTRWALLSHSRHSQWLRQQVRC